MTELLNPFMHPATDPLDIFTYADMRTGPSGEPVTVEARTAEIVGRYS